MSVTLHRCEQGAPEWFALRAGVITASNFSTAIETKGGLTEQQAKYVEALKAGKDAKAAAEEAGYKAPPRASVIDRAMRGEKVTEPSDSAVKLAARLAIERICGYSIDEDFSTWQMRRGQELEPKARFAYEDRTGLMVLESGVVKTDDNVFGYSTDGLVGKDGLVEIKSPSSYDKTLALWRAKADDEAKGFAEYIHQVQGGLWLTGRKWCDIVIYTPHLASVGKDLLIHRVERDEAFIDAMVTGLLDFKALVDANEAFLRA